VASFYLGIVHDTDLVRALESNPLLASACGIESLGEIPSVFAIGRFRRKLTDFKDAVADVLTASVDRLRDTLPGFGGTVAVDATDVKAWANSFKPDTDPDAAVGAKKKGHLFYWNGYKVHLAVDADSELPIWFNVTPANTYDGHALAPVLTDATQRFDWFKPEYVLADKGYDSEKLFRFVGEGLGATPIIDVQKSHVPGTLKPTKTKSAFRPCEAKSVTDMPGNTAYQCERRPYASACPVFTSCRWRPHKLRTRPIADDEHYAERYSDLGYGSTEWKAVSTSASQSSAYSRGSRDIGSSTLCGLGGCRRCGCMWR